MTKQELVELLLSNFYEDFANETAIRVIDNNAIELLYSLATNCDIKLSVSQEKKVIFRAAYVLEVIYFNYKEYFIPYKNRFCENFSLCTNDSAKRHFTKIMANLLTTYTPSLSLCEAIAEKSAEWAVEPKIRVAVKIWAIEVLMRLRSTIMWIDDLLPELFEVYQRDTSPAMLVRLKRWRNVRTL